MTASDPRPEAGARVEVWSRYGTDFTARFSNIAAAVRGLPVYNALIDGEAVAFLPGGHSDFAALRTKAGGARASYVAFDLLSLEGDDLRQRPLEERRDALSRLVAGVDNIQFSKSVADDGALVFAHACKLGLEGIVSKRAGSRYRSGTSRNWLKVLNPAFERREGLG
jgi:bifunctional non-homologous end joining protein LigD